MGTKTLAWLVMALVAALAAWRWFDPAGFSQNSVFGWFKHLAVTLPEHPR